MPFFRQVLHAARQEGDGGLRFASLEPHEAESIAGEANVKGPLQIVSNAQCLFGAALRFRKLSP